MAFPKIKSSINTAIVTHKSSMAAVGPAACCHFLRLPPGLRLKIYKEVFGDIGDFGTVNGQILTVDHAGDQRVTFSSHLDYNPPRIRQVCKQLYAETSDAFFRLWGVQIIFPVVERLKAFLEEMGQDNRCRLRYLRLGYYPLDAYGDGTREDVDVEIWSAVSGVLKKCFSHEWTLLETLELETMDDRNAAVRFGGDPCAIPRAVAITSTVQVMKLIQVFPLLKRLYMEEVLLLGPDEEEEPALENLPIVNFLRNIRPPLSSAPSMHFEPKNQA